MSALAWPRPVPCGDRTLRLSTPADAAGLSALMAEPEVERWWHQAWDAARWAGYVRGLLEDPHTLPLTLAGGDGSVAGYVEVYRVANDVLGRHIEHGPADLGMHLALGAGTRGRGLGVELMRTVREAAAGVLPGCRRLVAEPDERNTRSATAFVRAGFEAAGTVRLPDKVATLVSAPIPPTSTQE